MLLVCRDASDNYTCWNEFNPNTEHIEEPYSDKVKEILERKGVEYKKRDKNTEKS